MPNLSVQQATEALRSGMALVADHLGSALPAMFSAADSHLASKADADPGAAAARRFLQIRRDELRLGFASRLKQEQEQALGRLLKRDQPAASAQRITADSLTLLDDDQGAAADIVSIASRRMQGPLEIALRQVRLVEAHLAGRENVRADSDPFAPDACMKPLLDMARDLGLEASGWVALLGSFEQPLAEELGRGYAKLIEHFRKHRVDVAEIRRDMAARQALGRGPATRAAGLGQATRSAAADPATRSSAAERLAWLEEAPRVDTGAPSTRMGGPRTIPAMGGDGNDGAGADGEGGGAGRGAGGAMGVGGAPSGPGVADVRTSLDNMMARMNADLRGMPVPAALPSPGSPPADLLAAIDEMQHLGAGEPAMVDAGAAVRAPGAAAAAAPLPGAPGADLSQWREMLLLKSNRTVDKLTIEIVGMLFEHVLQDNQVPAEIKAVLSRLQFPVLKVALTDAEFFASSSHPARRLIDRLAATAVGWEPYGDENQGYKAEVERVVQQVLERFDKDVGLFDELLTAFDAFVGAMPAREADPLSRAKRALEEAEKREVLVINTTIQVRRAFENVELEAYLREFLVGPWVQALVSATMRDEQTPGFSKAFRQAIHDMVWSVQPKVSADERKRLMTLIPAMTRVLRDGLNMIRMPEHDQQTFLKQLMSSHAVAVRPVDQATYIRSRVATGELRQRLGEMRITGGPPAGANTVKVSIAAVRQAAENHSAQLLMPEPIANPAPISFEQDAAYDEQIAGWERGAWFNLYDGKDVIKVKLRWISPLRTLFMFSAGEESATRVLSPDTIKSYLRQGYLKPLESVPLTKRVVDRVLGELERSPERAEELANKIAGTTMAHQA